MNFIQELFQNNFQHNSSLNVHNIITYSFLTLAVAFSLGAAKQDLATRKISNKYNLNWFVVAASIKLVLLFVSYKYLLNGFLGALLGFVILLPFFAFRLAGGGDVKLLAALGMLLGWQHFCWVFALTTIWDGAVLIPGRWLKRLFILMILPSKLKDKVENLGNEVTSLKRDGKNPYALPVVLGCLTYMILFFYSEEILTRANHKVFDLKSFF